MKSARIKMPQGWSLGRTVIAPVVLALAGLAACSHNPQPGSGAQKRLKLSVGEISEISLPRTADSLVALTGTSDNSEVVDVSQKQRAATGTGSPASAINSQTVFLIKGITVGTARVVFAEKRPGDTGEGQIRKTYVVQVVSK